MAKGLIYQLAVMPLSEEQKDIVSAFLNDQEVEAIEETEAGLQLYHEDEDRVKELGAFLCANVPFVTKDQMSISPLPNQNWNHAWESSFQPIVIGDFCTVRATFHKGELTTKHVVIIDPEMAFGTGHHETTHSMIATMEDLDLKGDKVLDYGCGTAILAILAEQRGATEIDAIDYDPLATDCAGKCIGLNGCKHINLLTGELKDISKDNQYDTILANINRNVLLDNVNRVAIRHRHGGTLLISGVLESDKDMVVDAYEYHGYRTVNILQMGDWLCIRMVRV